MVQMATWHRPRVSPAFCRTNVDLAFLYQIIFFVYTPFWAIRLSHYGRACACIRWADSHNNLSSTPAVVSEAAAHQASARGIKLSPSIQRLNLIKSCRSRTSYSCWIRANTQYWLRQEQIKHQVSVVARRDFSRHASGLGIRLCFHLERPECSLNSRMQR